MGIKKSYAVIGLGRFGFSVAKELVSNGAEVLAVDVNEQIVNSVIEEIPICKCADITDAEVIKQLGIGNFDTVIIAMASNLEATVLATTLCKEAGAPNVIVKCANEMHKKILERIGADKVVFPESESGERMAKNLVSSGFVDIIELSRDFSMVEIDARPEWIGKTLIELGLRKKYSINIVAVKKGDKLTVDIDPSSPLESGTKLVVIADNKKLSKLN